MLAHASEVDADAANTLSDMIIVTPFAVPVLMSVFCGASFLLGSEPDTGSGAGGC